MRILAVDTTGPNGSIAVLDGEVAKGLVGFTTTRGHAQELLPALDRFLQSIHSSLSEMDGFAVAVGPGSFTGLRIGIATVEGLGFAIGRPAVGVSALEATVYRYRFREGLVAALLDARRGEVFGALFRADGSSVEPVGDPVCESPEIFLARVPRQPILFAGSGLEKYGDMVQEIVGQRALLAEPSSFLAEDVARIGMRLHEEGKAAPLGGLRAIYLRPSDAEKARREKAGERR